MAGEDEIYYVVVQKPLLHEELERLAREVADDEDQERKAEEIVQARSMRIALTSASRRQAYRRMAAQNAARDWFAKRIGVKSWLEIDGDVLKGLDVDTHHEWLAVWSACDVIGALVPEACENWEPPERLEDWAELKDYIFQPLIRRTWELNPQWLNEWQEQQAIVEETLPGN